MVEAKREGQRAEQILGRSGVISRSFSDGSPTVTPSDARSSNLAKGAKKEQLACRARVHEHWLGRYTGFWRIFELGSKGFGSTPRRRTTDILLTC